MDSTNKNVLIIGASSAIAIELIKKWAAQKYNIYLVARDKHKLDQIKSDACARGAQIVESYTLDLAEDEHIKPVLDLILNLKEPIDIAVIIHGTLTKQKLAENDFDYLKKEMMINCYSTIKILSILASKLSEQNHGTICVVSSVAADRGRKSNYVYGAAKACVTTFMQGIRNRLYPNINVLTVKPGFVNTPMTREFKKGILWVQPEVVARDIEHAIKKKKDVIYSPWYWYWIMFIIKLIPEKIFKRLNL